MTSTYVPVLDTSGWQAKYGGNGVLLPGAQPFDFTKARALGVQGVIHRVGNGSSFDQSYPLAEKAAREAGIAFGAYYYFQPNRLTADAAAELVEKWMSHFADTALPVMLDCEHYNGLQWTKAKLGEYIQQLLDGIEARHGRKPLIYSGAWWWNSRVSGDFSGYDTMQARYPRYGTQPPSPTSEWESWIPMDKEPLPSVGLGDWDGWQFTSDLYGPDFGMPADAATKRLDGNIVKKAAWDRWLRKAGVTPPPAPVDPVWPPFDPWKGWFSLWPLHVEKPVLRKGAEGDAVAYLQSVMHHKASDPKRPIVIDGDFGPQTEGRVKDVQTFFGIHVDGVVGWDGGNGSNPGDQATWPIIDMLAAM